jgi:hypothetical protein
MTMPAPTESKKVKIHGIEVELYYIGELADRLGRTSQSVRKWEIAGWIPKTIFKDKNGRRMYSNEQIEIIVQCAEETRLRQGYSTKCRFSELVHKRLNEYNKQFIVKKEVDKNDGKKEK